MMPYCRAQELVMDLVLVASQHTEKSSLTVAIHCPPP